MGALKTNAKWILLGVAVGYFLLPAAVNMVRNR